jgi:metal-sulfur cluster biosynthetic enzyme
MGETEATPASPAPTPTAAASSVAPVPPATGAAPATGSSPATPGPNADVEGEIMKELKKIYDPEIPMNIVDLGLIYGFEWSGSDVTLHMTLTAPGCPVAGILADEIKLAIEKVPKVAKATVDFVWEPPWTPEKMSEFARRQFGYL